MINITKYHGLLIIFVLVIVCISGFKSSNSDDKSKEEEIYFIPFIISIISFVFVIFLPFVSARSKNITYKNVYTENIIALNDNNIVNGKGRIYFTVTESQYYQYIIDTGNGFIQNQISAKGTIIKYDKNPRVEWIEKRNHFLCFYSSEIVWNLYIPEGSITKQFNIDLE